MTPAKVTKAFADQARACADLGSPFMDRLLTLFAQQDWPDGAIRDRIFDWPGEIGGSGQSISLRLAGALHALVLNGHSGLRAVYPPKLADDATLWQAVSTALTTNTDFINNWLASPPQTNEVRRSAVLIPLGHWLSATYGLPMRTSELGASGGLNLHWDHFGIKVQGQRFGHPTPALTLHPDWTGPLPPQTAIQTAERAGVDLNPLNPSHPDDALRLMAYLWPDQAERMTLTQAAIAAAKTPVEKGDAVDWIKGRLTHQPGKLHLIYSTIAWQYLPKDKQAEGIALIEQAGRTATDTTPLAWFGMEPDETPGSAALTLRLWPGDLRINMGRADFHGRWVHWAAPHPGDI